jgi:TRAP-type C4-dicarboxylate transport system substrate-binding protein
MRRALATAALVAALTAPAGAEEVRLIFATVSPPSFSIVTQVHHPWAARVNAAGKGVIQLDVRDGPGVANPLNFYDRVVNDVVQVSWGLQGLLGGKFPLTQVVAIPFTPEKSEHRSVALWRLYKTGLLDSEYGEIVPFAFVAFPHNGVHTAKPLKSPDDISGVKLIVASKMSAQTIARLGGTPITLPLLQTYESLQRGTVDGVVTAWTAMEAQRLDEVTSYHVDVELGGSTGILFMGKKRYDALPAAARKILDDHTGEGHTRTFGRFWDSEQDRGRAIIEALPGKHTVVSLTPAQEAEWRRRVAPVAEEWARETPNGEKLLGTYRSLVAQVKAGR